MDRKLKIESNNIRHGFEQCPTCGGSGLVARWLIYGDDGGTGNCTCPTCNGIGVVTVAKADAIRNFNQENA